MPQNRSNPTETRSEEKEQCLVVGIGVAAEEAGLAAEIVTALGDDFALAIVVVWSATGQWGEAEKPDWSIPCIWVDEPMVPQPGRVYTCGIGQGLEFREGHLVCVQADAQGDVAPIDRCFGSLASARKELAVGVVLAGGGSDGALGLRSISDAGGMTIAQSTDSARQSSMPQAALSLGIVDHVLTPDQIAAELLNHAEHMQVSQHHDPGGELNRQILIAIPRIAALVERHTDNDFKHYKTTTLVRRIRRRIHVLKLPTVDAYATLLETSRDEAVQLFRDLLIGVTAFFRDPEAFQSLGKNVIAKLVAQHSGEEPLRVWVPGCSTGQEPYSIAMLFDEIFEQAGKPPKFQIFATDLDQRALAIARAGAYPIGITDELTAERLKRHFVKRGNRYFVNKTIRDTIVFSPHNLISDPPFTKVDLISCRNLLIYLGSHLQKKLIPLFHYAIRPSGYLFLGPAETLSVNRELFRNVDLRHRLYQRRVTAIDRAEGFDAPLMNLSRYTQLVEPNDSEVELFRYTQQIVLGEFSPQWCVVDDDGQIQTLSSDPSPFLTLGAGAFKNNIINLAHDHLRIGLRAAFAEAKEHRRRALAEDMSVPVDGGIQRVHITVQPMPEMGRDVGLHLIAFHRIGVPLRIEEEDRLSATPVTPQLVDQTANRVIEQLELELAKTRQALEKTVQDLESSNEELKSSNEELLSMNEEMQSANEELESSKEELQFSNESLVRNNTDIQNLLRSTQIATIFLDGQQKIRGFTPAITSIYDLRESDIGRSLSKFVAEIQPMPPLPAASELGDDDVVEDTIGSVGGKTYLRRVIPYRGPGGEQEGIVVTFNDVTALSRSEQLFKSLIEISAQIVWITDADGRVVEDSPSWRAFTGQSLQQWFGDGWVNAVHPDDRDRITAVWRSCVASGEPLNTEYRLMHNSGAYRWTEVRAVANRLPSGEICRWVGMNVDIDDRKRAAEELTRTNELVRTIAENSAHALIMMNAQGYLTYCNQAGLDMFGFDAEEIRSKPLHDLIHHHRPDGRPYPMSECPIDRALPEDFSVRAHEDLFFRKDGSSFPVLCAASPIFENGIPVSTVIEVRDITEQKRAQEELLQREAHLRRVINGTFAFLGVLDLQGRMVEVNTPALQAAGITRQDVIGRYFWETPWWNFSDEAMSIIREAFEFVITGKTFREDLTYRVRSVVQSRVAADRHDPAIAPAGPSADGGSSADGGAPPTVAAKRDELRMVDFNLSPVIDDDGNVAYLIASGVDVTDRHGIEKSLQLARAAAEAANESKSTFLANMSHEIRTPMTAILGYIDLVADNIQDEATLSHIRTIRRNGDFLLDIINDILDLSKIEAGKLDISAEVFSPDHLIEDVQSIMSVRAKEKNLEFVVEYRTPLPPRLLSDAKRIRQVLINLIGNAIKFTLTGQVKVWVGYQSGQLTFDVIDTGIGMSSRQIENLFLPFSQGDGNVNREFGGTGLGLAISRRLAEMLGGKITVRSELARGSTFSVSVAATEPENSRVPQSQRPAPLSGDQPVRLDCEILVVDDRRDIRLLSKTFLTQAGAIVEEAEDGNVAIAMVTARLEQAKPYRLVLLDMQMPHRDGYQTARLLRQIGYSGPIIALTADAMQGDMNRCLQSGCNDYLSKPIDRGLMLQMVARYVAADADS